MSGEIVDLSLLLHHNLPHESHEQVVTKVMIIAFSLKKEITNQMKGGGPNQISNFSPMLLIPFSFDRNDWNFLCQCAIRNVSTIHSTSGQISVCFGLFQPF